MTHINVRGAHSGFMKDGYAHSDSNVACARVLLLRQSGVEEKHSEETLARFALGNGNEDYFCDTFLKGLDIQRDVALVRNRFEGHADVIYGDVVYELKSVTSKYVWANVQKGKYKLSNLAQLVGYLWASGNSQGVLAYTYYVDSKPTHTVQFAVAIVRTGHIVVDGKDSGYTLAQWYAHHQYLLNELDATHLHPDQPIDPGSSFATPCTWCPWSSICDGFNPFKSTSDDFISQCKKLRDAG